MTKTTKLLVLACICAVASAAFGFTACGGEQNHVHEYGEWTVTKAATCTENGEERRECSGCGEDTEGHFETRETQKLGHEWDGGVITRQPTCAETGIETFTCQRDQSHTREASVAKVGHAYGEWVIAVAPTATSEGKAVKTCTVCGEGTEGHTTEFTLERLTAENVAEGKYTYRITDEATCTEVGEAEYTVDYPQLKADGVNVSFPVEIQAAGHAYTTDGGDPVFGEGGTLNISCSRCGNSFGTADYDSGLEFSVNEGIPSVLESKTYFVRSAVGDTGYFTFTVNAAGVHRIDFSDYSNGKLEGAEDFVMVSAELGRTTLVTCNNGEFSSSDSKFKCQANNGSLEYIEYNAGVNDLGKIFIVCIKAAGTQDEPHDFIIGADFPQPELESVTLGENTVEITVANSYIDKYKWQVDKKSAYRISITWEALNDRNFEAVLDGTLTAEGTITGAMSVFNLDDANNDFYNRMYSGSSFIADAGEHILTFIGYTGSYVITIEEAAIVRLSPEQTTNTGKIIANGGTRSVLVSEDIQAGWYKVWANVNQGNARNPLAFVLDGVSYEKYYNSDLDNDSYAVLMWVEPGDEIMIKNIGLEDKSYVMNMEAHVHDESAGEWTFQEKTVGNKKVTTAPTETENGVVTRKCGALDEIISLPPLTDSRYTKKNTLTGARYTITLCGLEITFIIK